MIRVSTNLQVLSFSERSSERHLNNNFYDFTAEALHLAHLMAAHGYFFPIDDHVLTVKNDNTFYRFQVRYTEIADDRCYFPTRSISC